jgi:eukaryotic-like serine/threonine-protein kinase
MSVPNPAAQLPTLAKYELLEELGHGGMAVVYRARDVRLDREVAVKVIHKHLRESAEVGRRFAAEARAVAKLRHPNIIEVYDVSGDDEDEKYLVVELSRGITLRKLLTDHGALPAEVAAAVGMELGSALAHAHAAGVVHRDVKPENVMIEVGAAGSDVPVRVKLTDFGIAKILDAQGVTSTGQVLGSPAHMAPEQIEGGDVDGRADIFALGVLLYECMVGHLPFEGNNPAQVLRRVLEGSYAPADREAPLVGGRHAKILARALAKDPEDRYRSVDVFAKALGDELARVGIPDHQAEMRSFFGDPEGHCERLAARFVPVLTRLGEEARRAGDIVGAAADFNRALAYAPRDSNLPRLILRLRRGAIRRKVLLLAAAIGCGAAVLGGVAFVVGRAVVRHRPAAASGELSARTAKAPAEAAVLPLAAPAAAASASARAAPPRTLPADRATRRAPDPLAAPDREVRFNVNPKGARVSIDGRSPEEVFNQTLRLSVGMHTFAAEVPGSDCCQKITGRTEEIRPDDGAGKPQVIVLSLLPYKEARLRVLGAPDGAAIRCSGLPIDGPADREFVLKMQDPSRSGSCKLEAPDRTPSTVPVSLRAGTTTEVRWPGP